MTLGKNIARLRHASGQHNAAAFARAIGVSAGNLGDWEKGRYQDLRLSNLLRIAKQLQVSVDLLLAGVDDGYDQVLRQRSSDTKKMSDAVTSSDTGPAVSSPLPASAGDLVGGDPRAGTAQDRASESAATVRMLKRLGNIERILEIADQLSVASRDLVSIATRPTDPRGVSKKTLRASGDSGVRRAAARRRGGR